MSQDDTDSSGLAKHLLAAFTSRRRLKQLLSVPLYRNALYLMAGSAMTGIFGLVFWLVAAKLHDADTIGLASAAVSAMLLLSTLGTLGLDYAVVRFLPNSANPGAMINTSLTVGALAAAVMSVVFVAGTGLWSPVLLSVRRSPLIFGGFVIFTVAFTLFMIQSRTFVARRRAEFSLAQNLIFNVLRVGLLVLLAVWFGAFGIVSAWGVAMIAAVAGGALVFQSRLESGYRARPALVGEVVNKLVRYSLSNYLAVMLWMAPGYVLPLIVANLEGTEANAYFYIAWSVANILFQLPLAISFSLFAEGSVDEGTMGHNVRRSLMFCSVVITPLILLLAVFGRQLLGWFDPEYADNAASLLRILAISAVPLSINSIYFVVERVRMKMGRVIALNALVAVATLTLAWILLPEMGLVGVGIAWVSSQSVAALAVVALYLLRTRLQKNEPQELTS
ncbi:MAG: lipopolysaccharide biosynthesis protein [Dehalococcoidia bacterium]|nr:lipopolysaccharide biosynthesis protein [Dehalococcoidia bacterium]